jgi:hypothetical protein
VGFQASRIMGREGREGRERHLERDRIRSLRERFWSDSDNRLPLVDTANSSVNHSCPSFYGCEFFEDGAKDLSWKHLIDRRCCEEERMGFWRSFCSWLVLPHRFWLCVEKKDEGCDIM